MTLCLMKNKKIVNVISFIVTAIYYPVYITAWFLHKVLRLLLAITHLLLLDTRKAYDIISNLFTRL